ncbi:hypothetical protein [Pseudanabaena yagii]|uniref:Uncharacterized protein n=1 Tax=Pseudanabaena yagii GIHE-NHR1 TaxID=2722753 RepID=A0ABX1LXW1_9CYAN|nr:hypothetical protein [Pseudanabaena yagii]NMF60196.1 hypothetical protein [Pseudanabaena yagii GIHE-NHR1]
MSNATETLSKQFFDNLQVLEDRAKSLKENIQSSTKKTQSEIQSSLVEIRTNLSAKKHEFDEYRTKLQTQFAEQESELKSNIEEWKTSHEVKNLENRADKAEEYASNMIYLAMATMEEAEEATLAAISSRLDADAANKS